MKIQFRLLTDHPGGPVDFSLDTDRNTLAVRIPSRQQGHHYEPEVCLEYRLVPAGEGA